MQSDAPFLAVFIPTRTIMTSDVLVVVSETERVEHKLQLFETLPSRPNGSETAAATTAGAEPCAIGGMLRLANIRKIASDASLGL